MKLYYMLFLVVPYLTFGQSYKLTFEKITERKFDEGETRISHAFLYVEKDSSIFVEDKVIDGFSTEIKLSDYVKGKELKGKKILGDSLGQIIYKNKIKDILKQRRIVADYKESVYVEISDSLLPTFDWILIYESQEILGFNVQKAKTTYNGREIIAWYTDSIKIIDGPWKFSGLPGLILKVEIKMTEEIKLIYSAIKIESISSLPFFKTPTTRIQSLKEVERGYINSYKNLFNYYKTKSDGQIELRKDDLDFKPIIFNSN